VDQSYKVSMSLNFAATTITYFKFQNLKHKDKKQFLAFGNDGNMYIYEVPPNLKTPQDSTDKTEEQ